MEIASVEPSPAGDRDHHHHDHPGGLRGLVERFVSPHGHDTADAVAAAVTATDEGVRALEVSLEALGTTAGLQLIVVVVSGSVALLSDTIHNVADALTAVPLGVAFWVGRRPPNRRYNYGYGRAEDLAGIVIVLIIAASSTPTIPIRVSLGTGHGRAGMSEDVDRYQLVAAGFDQRVKAVPSDRWDAQSPCDQWTARDVVAHVVGNHRSMAATVTGTDTGEMSPEEDPVESWTDAYGRMLSLCDDPEALTRQVNGPAGPIPLEQALGQLVSMDTHVHTWDLARSVGGDEHLDPEVVHLAFQMLQPMDDMIRIPGVFGPKLDPPPGADEQTQLLYFLGRRA